MKRKVWNNRFAGKTAIVTGGSTGIGKAIVAELAREGAKVVFSGRSRETGEEAEAELKNESLEVKFFQGDMGKVATCKSLIDFTVDNFQRFDYLVNNAFSFVAKSVDAEDRDWDLSLHVGPIAYSHMMRFALEPMKLAGGGAIVNMSSISAHIAQKKRWTYNAAKGAVNQLTRCAALDLAEYGIRVNSVSPALIWTRELEKGLNKTPDPEAYREIWNDFHMLRRIGHPVECAGPVLFLLSDDASFITGVDLPIDGGFLAMGPQGIGKFVKTAGSK
jgi:NAD(P)-dependent dehydrogenase (short-subunit alcohol dehydrogenase family)